MGLEYFVCDEIPSGIRETLRASGQDEVSVLGWCIGGTLSRMHCGDRARHARPQPPAAHDARSTRAARCTSSGPPATRSTSTTSRSVYGAVPGRSIDWANKLMKPVTNYWTTYRRLWEQVLGGRGPAADAYQAMARWVADNPPFPGRAYREWITWMYKENRLVRGRMRLAAAASTCGTIDQNVLVVTAGADHIAPRQGTLPLLDMVGREDVTHFDRPGGHIGLMAGSRARKEIWPEIAEWLGERSDRES